VSRRPSWAAEVAAQIDANATQGEIFGFPDGLSPNKLLYSPPALEGSSVALARTGAGVLEALGTNTDGNMFFTRQSTQNANSWNAWTPSKDPGWLSVGMDTNADGRAQILALKNVSNEVWQRQQFTATGTAFTGLSQLSGLLQSVAVAPNQNGVLELLGVNKQGQAFYATQTAAGASTFSDWTQFTGAVPLFASIAAERDATNLIKVFALDTHGNIWTNQQTTINTNTWTGFTQLSIANSRRPSEIAVARDSNNTLDLIAVDAQGMWQSTQTTAGASTWTTWANINTNPHLTHLAAETNTNGTVQVLTVDSTGNIWSSAQTAPGLAVYNPWLPVTGALRP
jgi:tectonin-like protein